jgi:tight adherence protein B
MEYGAGGGGAMSHSAILAIVASICLLSIAGAAAFILRQQSKSGAITERISIVTERYSPATRKFIPSRSRRATDQVMIRSHIEHLFGYYRERRPHQDVAFLKVVPAAFGLGFAIALVDTRVFGPIGWIGVMPLWLLASQVFYRSRTKRYRAKLYNQFPDALGTIVRAVRVGVGVGNAIVVVAEEAQAPTCDEFRQLSDEIAIGRTLPDALRAMAVRNDIAEYRFFATALALQSQTGGGLIETLETLADTIRKRVAIRLRGYALAGEARLSCYVLGGLPFVVGLLLYFTNPAYVALLFTTTTGKKLVGVAAVLLCAGVLTMQTMTKRALQ